MQRISLSSGMITTARLTQSWQRRMGHLPVSIRKQFIDKNGKAVHFLLTNLSHAEEAFKAVQKWVDLTGVNWTVSKIPIHLSLSKIVWFARVYILNG